MIEHDGIIEHNGAVCNGKIPQKKNSSQPAFTCSKLTIETLEQSVKYVRSFIVLFFIVLSFKFYCLYC